MFPQFPISHSRGTRLILGGVSLLGPGVPVLTWARGVYQDCHQHYKNLGSYLWAYFGTVPSTIKSLVNHPWAYVGTVPGTIKKPSNKETQKGGGKLA